VKRDCDLAVVDIGNTSVKVATMMDCELVVHTVGHREKDWENEVVAFPKSLHGTRPTHWTIASVNQKRASALEKSILAENPNAYIRWIKHHDVPMNTCVDEPTKLGIDRLLSGFIASNRYPTPLVIVSFGTAVTVDWVGIDKIFAGGLIIPGLQLQSDSLSLRTEALPELQWGETETISIPGTNTLSAIRSGIILGLASAIDGFVIRYAQQSHRSPPEINTIITGGDAETITPHLKCRHQYAPHLVCHALMMLEKGDET
jgi:pantothenate kinase type III